MWNFLGILSSALFLFISPEISKNSDGSYQTIFNEKVECDQLENLKYCVSVPPNPSAKILYFFHGVLHNEKGWLYQRKNFELRQKLYAEKIALPVVVSVSLGSLSIFQQKDSQLNLFLNVFLPFIEAKYLKGNSSYQRYLYGKSMGGFNALQVAFQAASQGIAFEKLALGCPFIPDHSPFQKVRQVLDEKPLKVSYLKYLLLTVFQRIQFKNDQDWGASSPLLMAQNRDLKGFPEVFITGGIDDDYDFMGASQKLIAILKEKGISSEIKEIPGSHCVVDTSKIMEFMRF